MFNKILIANRGEVARRIIRTCRRMGIATVAVYSEADAETPFVEEADEAVLIGPAQAKRSYLSIDAIMSAAQETGAEAIHPGYGFLAENPQFAKRCHAEGITFIGPDAERIRMMGSKLEARRRMEAAGVPIVPGWDGALTSAEKAREKAEAIGYPLMLKASAGGGGIGMQLVHDADELDRVFSSTMQRAESFFGDGTLFLEKWVARPRHIEVQVACDAHGNAVHLFERECSVQRRHQKVVEECPSPFLNEERRQQLLEAALRGARHIGYRNIGTMEFIFDGEGNFYFLEMNTRLQVEHPVTEETVGVDLVEWQIRIAAGEPLPQKQDALAMRGHALECRLYAEDPETFFPSPGVIDTLVLPRGDYIRLEFGVAEGTAVSPFYDAMIGKLVTIGDDRNEALRRMDDALKQLQVEGIATNKSLLQAVIRDRAFREGHYDTHLAEQLLKDKKD